jgi:myo-inositol 2-dehydrogenase/D-chiro-inositol 1-dehydrogenase/scyllo-inositol 2-dehydrogenase (NAD+)
MRPVRICLVGAGRAGMVHGRNFARAIPGARLEAIVDPDAAVLASAAQELGVERTFSSLEDALAAVDCDAVCIATPTFTHRDLTVAAAAAGKHVLCEKPMALDVPQALQMLAAARRAGIIFQMGFMRRFDEEFMEAKALIDAGAIGQVTYIRSLTRGPGLPPPWAWSTAHSNGMLAEVNSHDFDVLRWLTGAEFARVFAQVRLRKALQVSTTHPDFYDVAAVLCEMTDGTLGVVEGACPVDYGYDARAEVLGTEGLLTVGAVAQGTVVRTLRDGRVLQHTFHSWRDRHRSAYLREDQEFVESIRSGNPPRVGALDGLRALEAVLAASRSARSGRPEIVQRHDVVHGEEPVP